MHWAPTSSIDNSLPQRERILDAAYRLVSEGGWARGRVADVAAAAGLASGTVYRHFPSRAELFVALLEQVTQREMAVMGRIIAGSGGPAERLHALVRSFIQRAMHNRRLTRALIAEPCEREVEEARLKLRLAIAGKLAVLLEQGKRTGDLRTPLGAELAAALLVGGFMEALASQLAGLDEALAADSPAVLCLADDLASSCCASVAGVPALRRPAARAPR